MTRQVFVDLDDTVADTSGHHERLHGWRPNTQPERRIDWEAIGPEFYDELPMLPDANELLLGIRALGKVPTFITGVKVNPAKERLVREYGNAKRRWIRRNIGTGYQVITCPPQLKYMWCAPGDIIIDDWPKYRTAWERAGGHWILHTSAKLSLAELRGLLQ